MSVSGGRDERIATIAELQRGRIARDQLHALGIPDATIARRVAQARLVREHRSVYVVRPAIDVALGRETAALLACGPNALLSHGSAAALWKLCEPVDGPVEVTISNRRHRQTPGICAHRTRHLLPRDVRVHQGLPVTSPARTLLDRAATLTVHELTRELDEALVVLRIVRPGGSGGRPDSRRLSQRRWDPSQAA
ncbi:MAG: type IV toxin-antitoxin system AbiEi family antitoxin domain-containing protein [Solirubrobacterales bacterium]|nr:type IV toxin-antitoxin system AbiEi family antitoxin domain-containing protein [Solirubrobacterales bacterium]